MDFQEDKSAELVINEYSPEGFTINQQMYHGALVIYPDGRITPWTKTDVSQWQPSDFTEFSYLKPQALIIGTGKKHLSIHPMVFSEVYQARVGVEVMNSQSACHTFNIMSSEKRSVAVVLLPLS